MRRRCHKCGKVRECRKHRQGVHSCKKYVQAFCYKCQRKYYNEEWYPLNREYKLEYNRKYYRGYRVGSRKKKGAVRKNEKA